MEKLLAYLRYFSSVIGEELESVVVKKKGELISLNPRMGV